jgi:hypothetical protein
MASTDRRLEVSQEDVVALLDRAADDHGLRVRLRAAESTDALLDVAAAFGFRLRPASVPDVLTDADLEGISSAATDRTCHGTTDCCHTKRTCFGTTDCCN